MLLVKTLSLLSVRSNLLNAHLKYLADKHGAVLRRSRVRVCMHSVWFGRFGGALRASTSCEDAPRASLCQKIITRPASAFTIQSNPGLRNADRRCMEDRPRAQTPCREGRWIERWFIHYTFTNSLCFWILDRD